MNNVELYEVIGTLATKCSLVSASTMSGLNVHNHYHKLPIIASVTWYVTLLVLLVVWLASGRPKYPSQDGSIAYISDIGASYMKPFFIVGACITAVSFVTTLASERLLQHTQRLLPTRRRSETILSYCSIAGAILGGVGLILLSIFDTKRYTMLHRVFLFIFMLGVILSAIFTVVEYRMLSRSYASYNKLQRSYIAKGIIAASLICLGIAFGVLLFGKSQKALDAGAILEWVIGFGFTIYLLVFFYDLRLAADRHQVNPELKNIRRSRWRV